MFILFYIALGYLLITTAILIRNRKIFKRLRFIPKFYSPEPFPQISICIPARNEAESIERCVRSAIEQDYPNLTIHVLNDNSSDGTKDILERLSNSFPEKLTIITGKPKPKDWLGKSWACHQLSKKVTADFLIFLDADTWLEPQTTSRILRAMDQDVIDFATIWPQQKLGTFWEKIVIPIIYFSLFTLLPVQYVYRNPKWLPSFLIKKTTPFFAAACGQFMAFRKTAYEAIGGHASVKNKILEDVELAKRIKQNNFTMNMYHGQQAVTCRMYRTPSELWEGFRKNFLAGFGYNLSLFIGLGTLQFIAFILPVFALPSLILFYDGSALALAVSCIILMLLQRFVINQWFHWNWPYGLLHTIGVLWFQLLSIQVIWDYFMNTSVQWKNRSI